MTNSKPKPRQQMSESSFKYDTLSFSKWYIYDEKICCLKNLGTMYHDYLKIVFVFISNMYYIRYLIVIFRYL